MSNHPLSCAAISLQKLLEKGCSSLKPVFETKLDKIKLKINLNELKEFKQTCNECCSQNEILFVPIIFGRTNFGLTRKSNPLKNEMELST